MSNLLLNPTIDPLSFIKIIILEILWLFFQIFDVISRFLFPVDTVRLVLHVFKQSKLACFIILHFIISVMLALVYLFLLMLFLRMIHCFFRLLGYFSSVSFSLSLNNNLWEFFEA